MEYSGYTYTSLHHACGSGDVQEVERLLLTPDININAEDSDGVTALNCAVFHNRQNIVELLLSHPDVQTTGLKCPILDHAIHNSPLDVCKLLLEHKATDINEAAGPAKVTPLLMVCEAGRDDVLEILLSECAKQDVGVDEWDSTGWTTSHYVCTNGSVPMARMLLQHNSFIPINFSDHDSSPIRLAVRRGHVNIVRYLFNHWDTVFPGTPTDNPKVQLYLFSLLSASICHGHIDVTQLLIRCIHFSNVIHQTSRAIEDALWTDHYSVACMLLEAMDSVVSPLWLYVVFKYWLHALFGGSKQVVQRAFTLLQKTLQLFSGWMIFLSSNNATKNIYNSLEESLMSNVSLHSRTRTDRVLIRNLMRNTPQNTPDFISSCIDSYIILSFNVIRNKYNNNSATNAIFHAIRFALPAVITVALNMNPLITFDDLKLNLPAEGISILNYAMQDNKILELLENKLGGHYGQLEQAQTYKHWYQYLNEISSNLNLVCKDKYIYEFDAEKSVTNVKDYLSKYETIEERKTVHDTIAELMHCVSQLYTQTSRQCKRRNSAILA